jgi:hypothetical protein
MNAVRNKLWNAYYIDTFCVVWKKFFFFLQCESGGVELTVTDCEKKLIVSFASH